MVKRKIPCQQCGWSQIEHEMKDLVEERRTVKEGRALSLEKCPAYVPEINRAAARHAATREKIFRKRKRERKHRKRR